MATQKPSIDEKAVLAEALLNAGEALGLSRTEVGRVVGRDRSRLRDGIRPESATGQLALLLIRVYRSLYALVDGDREIMAHWMRTRNTGCGGVPAEQVRNVQGLVTVVEYLDAIRGKV